MDKVKLLTDFIRAKAESQASSKKPIDWDARKNKWITQIDALYGTIRGWLKPLEQEQVLSFLETEISLEEEYIGKYTVKALTLLVGNQRVSFYPKGTLIIGADGRIDIKGQKGVRTILVNKGNWTLYEKTPKIRFIPFNQHSFQTVLKEVME
ncbi:MAG: hypothetical protein WCI03_14040 [bacterium]